MILPLAWGLVLGTVLILFARRRVRAANSLLSRSASWSRR